MSTGLSLAHASAKITLAGTLDCSTGTKALPRVQQRRSTCRRMSHPHLLVVCHHPDMRHHSAVFMLQNVAVVDKVANLGKGYLHVHRSRHARSAAEAVDTS